MITLSKKAIVSIIMVVVLASLATGSTFLGIYLYRRYTPDIRYVRAEKNWLEASQKEATDDLALEIVLGTEENSLTAVFLFNGTRTYNNGDVNFHYEVEIIAKGLPILPVATVLKLDLKLVSDGDVYNLNISKISGMIDFATIEKTFTKGEIRDIDISMNSLTIYNDKNISIDKEGNFSIQGMESIGFLLDSVSLILGEYVELDLNEILSSYANIGRVRGTLKYKKDFVVSSLSSSHSISFFAPWEYIDTLVAEMDLPENIMKIYEERKIVFEKVIGNIDYPIDFNNYLPDGILANIRMIGDTSYRIIKK